MERARWSPWAATKMSPTPVEMIPATSPNSEPTLTAATALAASTRARLGAARYVRVAVE